MHIAIMPEKQPKRSNNNAKALESWESEGGAPASEDGSTKGQRLRDLKQITKAQPRVMRENQRGPRTVSSERALRVDVAIKCPECGSEQARPCTCLDRHGREWIDTSCKTCGHKLSLEFSHRNWLPSSYLAPCSDSSDEIPFAQVNTAVPQDVVGRGAVEIKVGQHEMQQILLAFKTQRVVTKG